MSHIRPVFDLRNNFADISRIVHETSEPVFLTKNGFGDMVVLSMKSYEEHQFHSEVYFKLKEAETEAKANGERLSHHAVFADLRQALQAQGNIDEV